MIHESQMINAEYDEEYFMAEPSDLKELPLETLKETVKAQPKIENQHLRDHRQYLGIDNHLKPHTISNSMISKTNYELAKQNGDQVLLLCTKSVFNVETIPENLTRDNINSLTLEKYDPDYVRKASRRRELRHGILEVGVGAPYYRPVVELLRVQSNVLASRIQIVKHVGPVDRRLISVGELHC